MARNKVQFQKSMSIHTFIQRYGDEAQCQQRRCCSNQGTIPQFGDLIS